MRGNAVFNISKIQSESNSQHQRWWRYNQDLLFSTFQRYNLKAIHNCKTVTWLAESAVFNISKIQSESNSQRNLKTLGQMFGCFQHFKDTIWKQFTTPNVSVMLISLLFSTFQRYNLKAIHNYPQRDIPTNHAVFNISKIQSESNSQPAANANPHGPGCFQHFKDTIWKQFTTAKSLLKSYDGLFSTFQRYNLKAIHNKGWWRLVIGTAVFNISKIQSESNSQRRTACRWSVWSCFQHFKDTIWKQFTTDYIYVLPLS